MKRGFMEVAVNLIFRCPGRTDEEYAKMALESNPDLSDAKDPIFSLKTTLAKQVRTKGEKRVTRERIDGKFLYSPSTTEPKEPPKEILISISPDESAILDDLINTGWFKTESEAAQWLLREGINARKDDLHKIRGFNELKKLLYRKDSK